MTNLKDTYIYYEEMLKGFNTTLKNWGYIVKIRDDFERPSVLIYQVEHLKFEDKLCHVIYRDTWAEVLAEMWEYLLKEIQYIHAREVMTFAVEHILDKYQEENE